jgi:hypothetical protein
LPEGHSLTNGVVIQFPVISFMPDAFIAKVEFDEFGVRSGLRPFM